MMKLRKKLFIFAIVVCVIVAGLIILQWYMFKKIQEGMSKDCGTGHIGQRWFDPTKSHEAKVVKVIDGDTLELENGEQVELIGIDCPEMEDEYGGTATYFVKNVIGDGGLRVRVEFDVESRDKYGRLLAYVYVPFKMGRRPPDEVTVEGEYNIFLNAYIIQSGYASPMAIPPNVKHADLFQKLYEEARENKRKLWKVINVGDPCQSPEDCAEIDCSSYDKPTKNGYKPDCVKGICKCMCYGCS